ncbi:MAG: ABC transporter permease [Bacteroidales bacterium]|nr:ABC transporter permease [Candidatus Colimorpha onthohippi]
MKKILLVIQREYLTRVRKPSFWILSIVVPLLIATLYALPIILTSHQQQHAYVMVVDETGIFAPSFRSTADITYLPAGSLDYAQNRLETSDSIAAILHIPAREVSIPTDAFLYYQGEEPNQYVQSDINNQLQTLLRNNILLDVHGITAEEYHSLITTTVRLHVRDLTDGHDGFIEVKIILALVLSMLIFMAVLMFGAQVMRGVMEEKQSRIVEVLICSVSPFQLMMGKIIGHGLVGLTQFTLWICLSAAAMIGIRSANSQLFDQAEQQIHTTSIATKGTEATTQMESLISQDNVSQLIQGLASIDFGVILTLFVFYFVIGYLLYATLFAAIGSITDTDTDTQQYSLPITIPLLIPIVLLPTLIEAPSGALAVWLSIIPFTSPIAMMFRIPFGVPIWHVLVSMALLLITFPVITVIAARIYKKNILRHKNK